MGAQSFPSALDSNTAPMAWVVNKPHPLVSIWKQGVSVSNLGLQKTLGLSGDAL